MSNLRKRHIYLPIICGVLIHSLAIFILEVSVDNMSPARSIADILSIQFANRHNLFHIMAFGLIPFAILIGATALFSRKLKGKQLDGVFTGGLVGILVFMIPAQLGNWFWMYSGHKMDLMAVVFILFILIPFICIVTVTMGIGLLIGWAISLLLFEEGR
jgi:hypothetical protein